MLCKGESILSLLIVEVSDESFDFYVTFFVGIVSVIFLQYLYFKSQPHHADGHAIRRSLEAGALWVVVNQMYSAALIIVGVSYKMLLTEFYYDTTTTSSYDNSSKTVLNRLLASSGGSGTEKYSTEDRRQRVAYFFCLGFAGVYIFLDVLSILHKGLKGTVERCHCPEMGSLRVKGIILVVVLRWLGIFFIGTACIYVTDPRNVAIVGFAAIVLQIMIRFLGSVYFPDKIHVSHGDQEKGHAQPNIIDSDINEDQWPNLTQPMAVKAVYDLNG